MSQRTAVLATAMAMALVALATPAWAEAPGLWSSSFLANSIDCGPGARDGTFCTVSDRPVELGVKFRSSTRLNLVGVRAYRLNSGAATASLWDGAGSPAVRSANFADGTPAAFGWQDAIFSEPYPIDRDHTYIASYYAPAARYAFEYGYFTNGAYTQGPITALQSVAGDGNGVFCYDSAPCFPMNTFKDTNYWVTPLWQYRFVGFDRPIDNPPAWNTVKAGAAIPVKFSLGGDQGPAVLRDGWPKALRADCQTGSAPVDSGDATTTAGLSSLAYDASADQYSYILKTEKAWAGKCYRFDLGLNDDSSHSFYVDFTR